jgi:hypothetical protein
MRTVTTRCTRCDANLNVALKLSSAGKLRNVRLGCPSCHSLMHMAFVGRVLAVTLRSDPPRPGAWVGAARVRN